MVESLSPNKVYIVYMVHISNTPVYKAVGYYYTFPVNKYGTSQWAQTWGH